MTLGIRGKLFIVSLALMVVVGTASAWILERNLRDALVGQIGIQLTHLARTCVQSVESADGPVDTAAADMLADRLGETTGARVTIIDAHGVVLGDSSVALAAIPGVENHATRPEVHEALAGHSGTSRRYSTTVREPFLYVAVPWTIGDQLGAVRLALPLTQVEAEIASFRQLIVAAAVVGLVVAIVMSGLASHWLSRSLRDLARLVEARSSGQSSYNRDVAADDEVGRLAAHFNDLIGRHERTSREQAHERERIESILESMTEAVLALDDQKRVTLANRAALSLLGLDAAPVGRALAEVVRVPALLDLVNAGRPEVLEAEFQSHGASPRRLFAHVSRLKSGTGTVVVLHDVTELRRLEQIRMDFISNLSHELRTPLGVIKANAETLADGALEDTTHARVFIEAIARQADRLHALVRDVLELARMEELSTNLEIAPVRVQSAVNNVIEQLRDAAVARNIVLETSAPEGLFVRANARTLEQALFNLVDNAIKYGDPGGRVRIRAEHAGDVARIEVEDDGPGIESRHHERIFERFYRVDTGRSRDLGGTGLGLAVVKSAVEAMRGRVGVKNVDPRGSLFWLEIPSSNSEGAQEHVEQRADRR
ncbi:MAG: PAS domain-containing protein [Deltaproteobacteria bacterium]|nr:PAS domain-containing protein [Deltaproteobacteria bacterium]